MLRSDERRSESIGERYRIEREIGRGGMATVYLAHDAVGDIDVAVKVLLPELAAALGAERFRREIAIERQLDHPSILGVLDSGEADGRLFYVMAYVAGESLRARLDREGQLPIDEAVRIAAEVAEGLEYAHRHGILHRDVKPENILLDDGRALVADFGIARALSSEAGQRLTQTGVSLGTPLYMSPEQAFAERDLDGRSDVYSLGCVLYEMLVGQPPFTGPNSQAIAARHQMEEVLSITVVRPAVSDEIEDLVYRALAKTRADRCTAGELAAALRDSLATGHTTERRTVATRRTDPSRHGGRRSTDPRTTWQRWRVPLLAATLPLLAAAGAAWQLAGRGADPPGSAGMRGALGAANSVAVLYFDDASPGRQLAHLADGLTEDLIADLERIPALSVASRDRVLLLRGAALPMDSVVDRMAGTALFVRGRVEPDGTGRIALVVQLADDKGATQDPRRFALPEDSSLALRDSLVRYVRGELGQEFRERRERYGTTSTEAWLLVKRAENAMKRADAQWRGGDTARTHALLAEADSFATLATRRDTLWPAPLLLRIRAAHRRAELAMRPAEARPWMDAALELAQRSVRLAPRHEEALELRGTVLFDRVRMGLARDTTDARRLVDAADRDLRAATELPNAAPSAWVRLSEVSYRKLNTLDANRAAREAYARDAYLTAADDVLWRLFATSYDLAQPEDAARWCDEGRRRFRDDPRFLRCELLLMTMSGARPDIPRAWTLVDELRALYPTPRRAQEARFDRILVAAALGRAGLADSARRVLGSERLDPSMDPRGEIRGLEAFPLTLVGDKEAALDILEQYLHDNPEHREGFARLNTWWWQGIRGEPRFVTLVESR